MEPKYCAVWVIVQLAFLHPALGKRALGRYEEDGSRTSELSVEDFIEELDEEELDESTDSLYEEELDESTDSLSAPSTSKLCNPFKRFASKSYYFDLKSGSQFVAIELKRVSSPQRLLLKIHINMVWKIRESSRGKVTFEPALPPKGKKNQSLTVDLLEDDVTIKSFDVKGKEGKTQAGIEFALGSGKKFAFAGGSYYPRVRVNKALQMAKNMSKNKVDKSVYANAGNADLVITPALSSIKTGALTLGFNAAVFFPSLMFFHETAFAIAPWSNLFPLVAAAHIATAISAGVYAFRRQSKQKRDSELSAAEKIHEVIWCLSTTTGKCSPITTSKNCFLACDQDGGKVFVRPAIAQKKEFKCS